MFDIDSLNDDTNFVSNKELVICARVTIHIKNINNLKYLKKVSFVGDILTSSKKLENIFGITIDSKGYANNIDIV